MVFARFIRDAIWLSCGSSDKLFLWWISAVTLSSTTFPLVDPPCQMALYLLWWYPNKLLKPSYFGGYQIWICQGDTVFLWWMLLYKNVALVVATPSSDNIFALADLHCQVTPFLLWWIQKSELLSLSSDKLWKHVLTKRFSTPPLEIDGNFLDNWEMRKQMWQN